MKLRNLTAIILLLSMISLILSGCTTKDPKNLLMDAFNKSSKMDSYTYDMSLTMSMDFSNSILESEPELVKGLEVLKNLEIKASGKHDVKNKKGELDVELLTKGDLEINFKVPVMYDSEKVWIKIPKSPLLQEIIPQEIAGKYLLFDIKQIMEQTGIEEEMTQITSQQKLQEKLLKEIMKIIIKHIDEKEFIKTVDTKNVKNIVNTNNAKDFIQIKVTNENFKTGLMTLVEKALPEIIDVVAKEEYSHIIGETLTTKQVQEAKDEIKKNKKEIKTTLDKMDDYVTIHDASVTIGINEEGFISEQGVNLNITAKENDESVTLGIKVKQSITDINSTKVKFEKVNEQEIIPFESFVLPFIQGFINGFSNNYNMNNYE